MRSAAEQEDHAMRTHSKWAGALVMTALAGVGCSASEADLASEAQALDTPALVARSSTLDLGAVAIGSTVTGRVSLTNIGRDVVDVTDVTFTSAFPPDPCRAVVIQPCIRPGESTSLEVTCAPTVAGPFGGRVAIAYQDASDSRVLSVSVTGQATSATR
jgi:hypothetical protein